MRGEGHPIRRDLDYLAERFGKFGWAGEDERREIPRWLLWDNHKLTSYVATLRFLLHFMESGETPVTEFLRGRALGALGILNRHLEGGGGSPCSSARPSPTSRCAAICTGPTSSPTWADHPHIAAWLERIKGCPGREHPYRLMPGIRCVARPPPRGSSARCTGWPIPNLRGIHASLVPGPMVGASIVSPGGPGAPLRRTTGSPAHSGPRDWPRPAKCGSLRLINRVFLRWVSLNQGFAQGASR